MCPDCTQVLNSQRETILAVRQKKKQIPFTPARRSVPACGTACQSAALTWVVEPRNDGGRWCLFDGDLTNSDQPDGVWCIFDGDLTNSDQPEERELPQHQSSTSDAAVSHRGRVGSTTTHAINAARS